MKGWLRWLLTLRLLSKTLIVDDTLQTHPSIRRFFLAFFISFQSHWSSLLRYFLLTALFGAPKLADMLIGNADLRQDASEFTGVINLLQASTLGPLLLVSIYMMGVLYMLWRSWKFTLRPILRPKDPQELPYWIPSEYYRPLCSVGIAQRFRETILTDCLNSPGCGNSELA